MLHLEPWHLAAAIIAAYGIGLSKTGIAGVGIVAVALFSIAMPGRAAVGVVLPLLVCADCFAVLYYRRNAVWSHLFKLFPWAALGIVLGTLALGRISDHQVTRLIGALLLALTALQIGQKVIESSKRPGNIAEPPDSTEAHLAVGLLASGGIVTVMLGILAGFATMVGNAAGPLMILYLLAARLPKMEFVGTGAWYFFCLNLFKVPFSIYIHALTIKSLLIDLQLAAFVAAGAISGRPLLQRIDQKLFENLAMFFTALAGVKLLMG